MSILPNQDHGKVTVPELMQRKNLAADSRNARKVTCLTAYDYPTARLIDEAGVDIVLVGDSVAMVMLGYDSTLPLTLDEALHHTKAVRRGVQRALVVADMPYGSYHGEIHESLRNAMRFVKEAGAEAVKIEGGERRLELISRLTEAEIPVMGHVGLTPQSSTMLGGFKTQGKTSEAARRLVEEALELEAAGCFAVVLEAVPAPVGAEITRRLRVPTIGIGAGAGCDGQVLVYHDLLGLTEGHIPRFVKRYANLSREIRDALEAYVHDVRTGTFPEEQHTYTISDGELERFEEAVESLGPSRD